MFNCVRCFVGQPIGIDIKGFYDDHHRDKKSMSRDEERADDYEAEANDAGGYFFDHDFLAQSPVFDWTEASNKATPTTGGVNISLKPGRFVDTGKDFCDGEKESDDDKPDGHIETCGFEITQKGSHLLLRPFDLGSSTTYTSWVNGRSSTQTIQSSCPLLGRVFELNRVKDSPGTYQGSDTVIGKPFEHKVTVYSQGQIHLWAKYDGDTAGGCLVRY